MKTLIEYATESGLSVLNGSVLAENTSMLSMCRDLGFSVRPDPEDLTVRNVELKLRAQ
jgi:acetyltransferase